MLQMYRPDYNPLRWQYWFGEVDSRPLSVFRIVLGLLLLKDAIYHFPIAHAFYSDDGFVPRWALEDGLMREYRFSLMDALPYAWMAQIFFALWVVVLILFTIGYRTRLMTILQFVMIVSVHERNIYVLNGADTVFRVLSFWSMFIPLGQCYSVDALRDRWQRYGRSRHLPDLRASDGPRTVYAFPVRMIQFQFALIYLFTAWLKLPGAAWREGNAIYYALQLKSLTLPSGDFLMDNAPMGILRVMSYQSIFTEWAFFFFVLLPFGQPALRAIALILGTLLHTGIALTMSIENFSMVMIGGYLLFFEPAWIEWLDRKLRRVNACSTLPLPQGASPLWLLLPTTTLEKIVVARGEARPGPGLYDWWIFDEQGHRLTGAAAWRRAVGHLAGSRLWGWLLRIAPLRRLVWSLLAGGVSRETPPEPDSGAPAHASPEPDQAARVEAAEDQASGLGGRQIAAALLFGLLAAAFIVWSTGGAWGAPGEWSRREWVWAALITLIPAFWIGVGAWAALETLYDPARRCVPFFKGLWRIGLTALLGLLFWAIVWWNLTTVEQFMGRVPQRLRSVPETPRRTIQTLGIWQAWDMFSPFPSTVDGWMVTPGRFEDGRTFDLRTGLPVTTEFRRWFWGPDVRWKKYESNLSRNDYTPLLRAWGSYYCRLYNDEVALPPGQRLATLEIHFYMYRSHAPGTPPNPMEDVMMWNHWCFPEYEY